MDMDMESGSCIGLGGDPYRGELTIDLAHKQNTEFCSIFRLRHRLVS